MARSNSELERVITFIKPFSRNFRTIADVAQTVKEVVGFCGEIVFNTKMPDGTKRKLLDVSKIENLGWKPTIALKDGLKETYEWFTTNTRMVRGSIK